MVDRPKAARTYSEKHIDKHIEKQIGKRFDGAANLRLLRIGKASALRHGLALLSELRGLVLPVLGNATVTERLLLLLCVALPRRRDDRGIDDLAAHRQETRSPQKLVEAPEQDVDSTGSLQSLTECPDRIGIGNRIRHADAQETHER